MSGVVEAKFPKKLQFLFKPHRYKIAYGGRGSAKSWSFARALLILGVQKKLRILCVREVQKSIKDSVHKLLSDQIQELKLGAEYQVLDTEIRGANGTEFLFSGLANHTVQSIKSFEKIDIAWAEEAQNISKNSWDILQPTIRAGGSEIWISFNPELDTDETYLRFVVNPPPDAVVAFINWQDNPWFNSVLEQERKHCEEINPEDYTTIWAGECRSAVVGAIYAKEVDLAMREGRITTVPYNPMIKVHTIWDLGWNDAMSILLVQRVRNEIAIIESIEDSHKTIDWYVSELKEKRYNWGFDFLPHDGTHKDFKTGLSTQEILKRLGRSVKITPNISVEEGIKLARMSFRQMVFDKHKSARLLECLKRYKRRVSKNGEPGSPEHDESSHMADAFRYLAINAESLTNENEHRAVSFNTVHNTVPGFN